MIQKVYNNLLISVMSCVWIILATIYGLLFIRNNYHIGLENEYGAQLEKGAQIFWLAIAIVVAWIIIVRLVSYFIKAFVDGTSWQRKVLIYSLPFLAVILIFFVRYYSNSYYYTGDEKNIWDAAVRLYPYFLYIRRKYIW